jgi:hypothetical protein
VDTIVLDAASQRKTAKELMDELHLDDGKTGEVLTWASTSGLVSIIWCSIFGLDPSLTKQSWRKASRRRKMMRLAARISWS